MDLQKIPVFVEDMEGLCASPLLAELCGKTVLVTGATGLIGQTLVSALLRCRKPAGEAGIIRDPQAEAGEPEASRDTRQLPDDRIRVIACVRDEEKARKRPDIELCRRTLIGAPSPKSQTVEAHYFGAIHPRVLAYMEDVERDMYRLGQIMNTRHNEVAPGQFEFAPVLAEANRGCDQNQMLMEVMRKMARRHHFQLLLHEKPFASVNGSGKHLNVSLRDSEGRNLLKPTSNPRRNIQFLSFISSFLMGVARHGGLLRACIASAGNSHRLGGNEAPPAVMSVFLGSVLDHAMSNIAKGMTDDISAKGMLDIGLDRLPTVSRDMSDRNRTSPIAFTGNKWEFRAVGAPQALGGPLTILLAIWAEGSTASALPLKPAWLLVLMWRTRL